MIYKENLKIVRERLGVTQKELAKILEISNSRYCFYENEKDIIPIKYLNKLCNYFNISLDYIMNFNNKKIYENSGEDIDTEKLKKRLKEIRKINNLTQVKLASILNVANSTVAEYERGTNIIATPFLYTICKNFNVSADYLLGKIDYDPMKKTD